MYLCIGRPCAPTFSRRRSRNDHTLVPGEPTSGTRPSDRGVSLCPVTEVSHYEPTSGTRPSDRGVSLCPVTEVSHYEPTSGTRPRDRGVSS